MNPLLLPVMDTKEKVLSVARKPQRWRNFDARLRAMQGCERAARILLEGGKITPEEHRELAAVIQPALANTRRLCQLRASSMETRPTTQSGQPG